MIARQGEGFEKLTTLSPKPVYPELVEGLHFLQAVAHKARRKGQWLTYGRLRLDKLSIGGFLVHKIGSTLSVVLATRD